MGQLRSARLRLDDESGMSLLEVIIATFVLSVAVIGLASVASASLVQLRVSRDRQAATDAATSTLEAMRLEDFSTVAVPAAEVPAGWGGCSPTDDEAVVTTTAPTDIDYQQTGLGPAGNITVTTVVTWYDDPDVDSDGDGSGADPCGAEPNKVKRVRVTASWQDAGGPVKTVTQDTFVSPADRGLPFPEFDISNPIVSLDFDPATEIATPTEKCLTHVIRNVGANDSYSYALSRSDGAFPPTLNGITGEWTSSNNGRSLNGAWKVRAFFEYPVQTTQPDPPSLMPTLPAYLELMTDSTTDADTRPETSFQVPTGDDGRLHICYRSEVTIDADEDYGFEVEVFSQFDDNVSEVLTHTVSTRTQGESWFLYDRDDSTVHKRSTGSGSYKNPTYVMGPQDTVQPAVLGSALRDWDNDVDSDGHGGIELPRGDTSKVARWDKQVTTSTEFDPSMTLTLWTVPEEILDDPSDTDGPFAQRLNVQIKRVAKNQNTVKATWFSTSVTYTHDRTVSNTWQKIVVPITLTGTAPFVLDQDEYLRLEVYCETGSAEPCHVAYDTTTYPSQLRLVRR